MLYKCLICDFSCDKVSIYMKHLNTTSHKAKKELKYMKLRFEDKLEEKKVIEILEELENTIE